MNTVHIHSRANAVMKSFKTLNFLRGALAATGVLAALSGASSAQAQDVRISMDWLIQGTHAPFFVAQSKGYFKDEGINPTMDSGKGATNVAVSVASGAYQFGLVDVPSMIVFNAKNPGKPLVGVYMYFDQSALAIISRASADIRKPADLMGKKIAAGPGTAAYDMISLILSPEDNAKVQWVPVQPQLFAAMLQRKEVEGLGGFVNSQLPAALEAGLKMDEISVMRFSSFGPELYGMSLATTKEYADANPEIVKKVIRAVNKGLLDTIADPEAALKVMKARDAMMKTDIEKVRLDLALSLVVTPFTKANGLSTVVPERVKLTVDNVAKLFKLENAQPPSEIFNSSYLPPAAQRMPK